MYYKLGKGKFKRMDEEVDKKMKGQWGYKRVKRKKGFPTLAENLPYDELQWQIMDLLTRLTELTEKGMNQTWQAKNIRHALRRRGYKGGLHPDKGAGNSKRKMLYGVKGSDEIVNRVIEERIKERGEDVNKRGVKTKFEKELGWRAMKRRMIQQGKAEGDDVELNKERRELEMLEREMVKKQKMLKEKRKIEKLRRLETKEQREMGATVILSRGSGSETMVNAIEEGRAKREMRKNAYKRQSVSEVSKLNEML